MSPLPNRGHSHDSVYLRAGFSPANATLLRSVGVPASVGVLLWTTLGARDRHVSRGVFQGSDVARLARIFSRHGLAALVRQPEFTHSSARSLAQVTDTLAGLAALNLPSLRGYMTHTNMLPLIDIDVLMRAKVRSSLYQSWWRTCVQPFLSTGPMLQSLANVYAGATVLSGLTDIEFVEWVTFAVQHQVPFMTGDPIRDRSAGMFLGGMTGLFVAAGISPGEATVMTETGVDVPALVMLAGLRNGTRLVERS